jgi:hypothetical protein
LKKNRKFLKKNLFSALIGLLVLAAGGKTEAQSSSANALPSSSEIPENDRIDCRPQSNLNEEECKRLGCQFKNSEDSGAPSCFLPPHRHWYSYEGPQVKSSSTPTIWSVVEENKISIPLATQSNYSLTGEPAVRTLTVEFERYSTRVMGFRVWLRRTGSGRFNWIDSFLASEKKIEKFPSFLIHHFKR